MADRCFYFGCWNAAGHYLFVPHRAYISHVEGEKIIYFRSWRNADGSWSTIVGGHDDRRHLDGSLAPRRLATRYGGGLCWSAQGNVQGSHLQIEHNSGECPQGQYLRHFLDNGFTAVQWWDRNQGDTRGACNSTILLEGEHTAEEVLAAGRVNFPHVFENLAKAGVELVEVEVVP